MNSFEQGIPSSGKRRRKLSVSELKSMKGFNDLSDAVAEEIIEALYLLSVFAYKVYTDNKTKGYK